MRLRRLFAVGCRVQTFQSLVLPSKTPQCYLVQASVQNTIPAPMNQFFNGTRVHDSVSFRSGKNSKLPVFRGKGSTIVVGRTPHPQQVASQPCRQARPKEGFFNSRIFNMCLSFFGGFQKGAQKEKSPWAIWGCSCSRSCFRIDTSRGVLFQARAWMQSFSAVCTPLLARVDVFY